MDSLIIYFDDITDSLDIQYFLSSKSNQDTVSNSDIVSFINYSDITVIFLLGLFTSLCTFTFCCTTKKSVPKYFVVEQEPVDDKIVSV